MDSELTLVHYQGTIWYRYNCKVEVLFPNSNKTRDLTYVNSEGPSSPIAALEKKNACRFAVSKAHELSGSFGNDQLFYAYDGVKNLITNHPINIDEFVMEKEKLGIQFKSIFKNGSVRILFEKTPRFHEIDLSNYVDCYGEEEFNVIIGCLDLITTQQALNDKSAGGGGYVQLNGGKSLTESTSSSEYENLRVGPGRIIIGGFTKNIKFVNIDGPCFGLSIDASKNVYYKSEPLDKIIKDEIFRGNVPSSLREFNNGINDSNIKGVYVETMHRKNGDIFKFRHDLHNHSAKDTFIDMKDGSRKSIAEYFSDRFNITLKYPEWPLFVHKIKRTIKKDEAKEVIEEVNFYPLEVLKIVCGQKVPINKMDPASASAQQRVNTSGPFERKGSTNNQLHNLGITSINNLFTKFGISVSKSSCYVTCDQPENPKVLVRENHAVRIENGRIKNENKPAFHGCPESMSLVIVHNERCNSQAINGFAQRYVDRCKENKIYFNRPSFYSCNTDVDNGINEDGLLKHFSSSIEKCSGKPYLILIDDKKIKKSHTVLKVFEQKNDVITQHITFEIASKCQNQIVTLDNVVRKTNSKLGGLNFHVYMGDTKYGNFNIDNKDTLYIGLDLSLTVPGTIKQDLSTSVGGWCANLGEKFGQYCGDYWYQDKKKDEPFIIEKKSLEDIFTRILERCRENSRNPPSKIIFFRCGLNEEQFKKSIENEFNVLIEMKSLIGTIFGSKSVNTNFTYVFVCKQDNSRFYSIQNNGCVDNVSPGTFISKEFSLGENIRMYSKTNPSCLGTAKLPLYYMAYDENKNEDKFTVEKFEKVVNMLCYTYDIIPSAISIPGPAYIAGQFVKRGSNNLIGFSKTNLAPFQEVDYASYSSNVNYSNKALGKIRFNA
ncbi:Protein argonaute-2 [Strongyloides ratti]|uniref:Protein argonaute-2 n=1 Tax=Strongyloides ratti TaxID=34506 RepID=A0A090L721_STRRB|nr:Protein argonaute-2 [Strongyloides ratti]CEF63923.2 Protein argonaute-2 [Strongyloides ratti]